MDARKEHRHGESRRGSFPDCNFTAGVHAVRILLAGLQGQPPLRLRILFSKPIQHEYSQLIDAADDQNVRFV